MADPWLSNHSLRDFALAGNINNISDLRSNLIRDSALTLPVSSASGRSADYPYYHGVELYLHSALRPMIGRQNTIMAVKFQFGLVGEKLRKELDNLPERERDDICKQASAVVPQRYTLGLVCRKPDALGPTWWASRDFDNPTNIGIVSDVNGTFTFDIEPDAKASELVAHIADRVMGRVLGVTVVNLTRLMAPFDEALVHATVDRQRAELAAALPKVEAHDRIAGADGSLNITEAAKALQVRPKDLFDYLAHNGWIYKRPGSANWLGYQSRTTNGDLEHKVTTEQVRITAQGLTKLAKLLPARLQRVA